MSDQQPIKTAGGIDITEGVQILYDMAVGSMEWGSGLLDNEEMGHVIRFAITMGWQVPELDTTSDAMRTTALAFPDQYEVVEEEKPWRRTRIVRR